MTRILAIDFGKKRIGLAISDSLGITITPLKQEQNDSASLFERIKQIIHDYEIEKIIIGKPIYQDGKPSSMTKSVLNFQKALRKKIEDQSISILLWDEQYTTQIAEERWNNLSQKKIIRKKKNKKDNLDSFAAAIILETYLKETLKGENNLY